MWVINRMGVLAVIALGCTRFGIRTMRIRSAFMLIVGRCIIGLIIALVSIIVLLTIMIFAV